MRVSRYALPVLVLASLTGASGTATAQARAHHRTRTVGASSATGLPTSAGSANPSGASGLPTTGGAGVGVPKGRLSTSAHPTVPGAQAKIIHGVAYAPAFAPARVQRLIWAGNAIRRKPYVLGGGHGLWKDAGYDCSGAVSYVLHAADLLRTSLDSSGFASWGQSGAGQWITVYTNPGHAFIQVAGIRLDTSAEGDRHPGTGSGPRWRPVMRSAPAFEARHPASF